MELTVRMIVETIYKNPKTQVKTLTLKSSSTGEHATIKTAQHVVVGQTLLVTLKG